MKHEKTSDFPPAPKDVEVVDIWPPGTFGAAERAAYDRLTREGRILPLGAFADDAFGRVVVRYLADIPAPWIRGELAEARQNGTQMRMEVEP